MTVATTLIADLLASGYAVQFQARGDSMDPFIRDQDCLHVEPLDSIRIGDVVLVLATRGLTAHRLIAQRDGMLITRGDNAPSADEAVAREQVLGKVTSLIRDGRKKAVSRNAATVLVSSLRRLRRRLSWPRPQGE